MKEGWEKVSFGDIMTPAKVERCGDRSDLPIMSITMHSGIIFQNERFKKVIASTDTKSYKVVKNGQLVIAFPIDEGLIYTQDIAEEGIMSPAYNIWNVDYSRHDRRFLGYYFHSPFAMRYYKEKLRGTTQRRRMLPKEDLLALPIPMPNILEQRKIVEEFDLLNTILAKKSQQLRELEKLEYSIFNEVFGDPSTDDKGWKIKKISDVCVLKSGNSESNKSPKGSLPYVKVGDMNLHGNETFITTSSNYVDRESNISNIFPIGTTIFPKRGGAILTNKKRLTKVEICCDLNVMGVTPDFSILHPIYVYFYFLRIDFKRFAETGSTIPQINNYNIAPLMISIPPIDIQNQFAERIEAIEYQKELIKQSIIEEEALFNSRMDYYFN